MNSNREANKLLITRFVIFSLISSTTAGPYFGTPFNCLSSCFIKAGEFDTGGEGYAYHDVVRNKNAITTRTDTSVYVDKDGAVGYLGDTEWYEYECNLSAAIYDVKYVLSGVYPAAVNMFVTLDNSCDSSKFAIYQNDYFSTGSYSYFENIYGGQINVAGGIEVARICFAKAAYITFKGFSFSKVKDNYAYGGRPQVIPGEIIAVNFDTGKSGVSFNDLSPDSTPKVRFGSGVTGSSSSIGYLKNGEWISYTVSVLKSGDYGLNYVLAGGIDTPIPLSMHLLVGSTDCKNTGTGVLNIDFRGEGWQVFQNIGAGNVALKAGIQTLTVCFDEAASINFRSMIFGDPGTGSASVVESKDAISKFKLVWSDEFNGNQLNRDIWDYNYGNRGGWGNNEKQYYQEKNIVVSGGYLTIEAKRERAPDGSNYTSGKIVSRGGSKPYSQMYGRIETRAKFDQGQGLWPAFWMMPVGFDMKSVYGKWPQSGEIDIFEGINSMQTAHHTIHFGSETQHAFKGCSYWTKDGFTDFHTIAVEWAPWGQFKYFVDGKLTCDITQWWTAAGAHPAPFNQPFYIILNLAVGGNWPGTVDDSIFATRKFATFDYVRVYEWPAGRRLQSGKFEVNVPDHWNIPPDWNPETNAWSDNKEISNSDALIANVALSSEQCASEPFQVDENGRPTPWFLPLSGFLSISAEFFDNGPAGCAYGDSTPHQNLGNNDLRSETGVDLMEYDYSTSGPYVSFMEPGEWLTYTVFSPEGAHYYLDLRLSSIVENGEYRVVLDSTDCSNPARSGGFVLVDNSKVEMSKATEFQIYSSKISISKGVHQLTFCAMAGSLNLDVLTFTFIDISNFNEDAAATDVKKMASTKTQCFSHCGSDPSGP